jgi:nucleotide-binding universal stress UspA family protein
MTYPIVVAVDGSASALNATRWAADEAAQRNLPLHLFHGIAPSSIGNVTISVFDALEADGRRQLAEAEAVALERHPGLRVDVELRHGNHVEMLIELSKTARLMVLGSRGLGAFAGRLAGSTSVALVAHGACPVAIVRDEKVPPVGGAVVVGVDGSPASVEAVAVAFDEASWRGVDLVAVHTWLDFSSDNAYAYARQFVLDWDRIEAEELEVLAQRLAGWQEKYPDVTVVRVVERDRPLRQLLTRAEDAQLLVVGSRGRGGFSSMLLGSTSQALIYHAPCSLIIARPASA